MSLFSFGKNFLNKNPYMLMFSSFLYNLFGFNYKKIKGKNNKIIKKGSFLKKCKFKIKGINNTIIIKNKSLIKHCNFSIIGSNNTIIIDEKNAVYNSEFCLENDNNKIYLGKKCLVAGKTEFVCLEGTEISIGANSLFSSDIILRTGDSHSVLDLEGNRINKSMDISIGEHNWLAKRVAILKGVTTCENTVIGVGAIVTKPINEANVSVAGVPAKIVKKDISWDINRI